MLSIGSKDQDYLSTSYDEGCEAENECNQNLIVDADNVKDVNQMAVTELNHNE